MIVLENKWSSLKGDETEIPFSDALLKEMMLQA